MLGAAPREHRDDVLDPAALDVGDDGLHRSAHGARPRGAPTRCSSPVCSHGRSRCTIVEAFWKLWPSWPIWLRHRTGNSPAQNAALIASNRGRGERAVADVRLDAVALAQRGGELAQAAHALGEHEHLLLAGDAGDRLGGDAAQQWQAVAAAAHRRGTSGPRASARASAARECMSVSGSTEASTNTPTLPSTTPWARASSASACL